MIMKIAVLMKVVPDTESRYLINSEKTDVILDSSIEWVIEPYDENALEEAIVTKEKFGGSITILTLGTGLEQQAIRKALAMGADEALWIKNIESKSLSLLQVSRILAKELKELNPDLILCGREATDTEDSFVGSAISEILSLPLVTDISKLEINDNIAKTERDAIGRKECFEVALPAILTVDWGINEPRYPKLPNIIKAKKKPIKIKNLSEFEEIIKEKNNLTQIEACFPPGKDAGIVFDGDLDESIDKLLHALINKEKVIL